MCRLKATLLLFALFVAAGCSLASRSNLVEDKYQISEITFERSGSWGVKSGYKVLLRKDGKAEYVGDVNAKRKGKHQGVISKEQFEQLAKLILANDFFSLEDRYQAQATDTDTIIINVLYSGGRKRVEDFGRGGGERLTEIERAIDNAAEQIAWLKDEG